MAIVIEDYTTATASSTSSSLTISKPSGATVGELLLLFVVSSDSTDPPSFNTPTGWNLIRQAGNSAPDAKVGAFWRVCDGTESSTQTITFTTGADYWVAWYLRLSGADDEPGVDPIGQSQLAANLSSGTSFIMDGITTNQPNTLAFALWGYDGADATFNGTLNSGTYWPTTIPSGQTLQSAGTSAGSSGGWLTATMSTEDFTGDCTIGASVGDGFAGFIFTVAPLPINTISGNVTLGGSPAANIPVTVVYADDSDFTNAKLRRVATTDSNGDWSSRYPEGKTAFAFCMYDDGAGNTYTSPAQGFVTGL